MKKGKDVRIHKTAIIKRPNLVFIGNHVSIDPFFYVTTSLFIGDNVHISSHVSIIGGESGEAIILGNVAISTGCRLICRSEDFTKKGNAIPWIKDDHAPLTGEGIIIDEGVILGANVVVLPNSIIHKNAVVGANSVVKGILEENGIYVGTPAKKIGVRK